MPTRKSQKTRRRFLTTSATLSAALAVAGCSGFLESDDDTSDSDDDASDSDDEATETATESGSNEAALADISGEYTLQEGDGTGPTGDLAKPLTFQGSSGERAIIEMSSDEIDTYLLLTGPDGSVVAEDDDGGSGLNSRITTTLDQTGEYTIWCGSFSGNETGQFTLSISQGGSTGTDSGEISYGESRTFLLEEGDGYDPAYDNLAKPVHFDGTSGQTTTISMTSVFDTYLVLEGPDGSIVAEDDDGGSGLDSEINITLSQTGEYTIWCGSFGGDETGQFTLSLSQGGSTGTDSGEISYGESRTFLLEEGDGYDPAYDDLAKPVRFDGTSGQTTTISMTSSVFDTFLILEGPYGSIVAQDDDGGSGLNSQITTTLEASGEYTIWCGSYSGDETGQFTLSLDAGSTSGSRQ